MKIAITQPYFIPYFPYWQLIKSVDIFIVLDDVNYMKNGRINRNIIRRGEDYKYLTIPVIKQSPNRYISEHYYDLSNQNVRNIKNKIKSYYWNKKQFHFVEPLLNEIFNYSSSSVSDFNTNSIIKICEFLDIKTIILKSSSLKHSSGKGLDRVISIIRMFNVDHYINSIGGMKLYSKSDFESINIELSFLSSRSEFVNINSENPSASILDILMNNDLGKVKDELGKYDLL